MRRVLLVLGVCLVLLVAADLVAGRMSPDQMAFDAAWAKCRAEGLQDEDKVAIRSSVSNYYFVGKTATVEIDVKDEDKDKTKTIRVTLRKPVNFLPWQVVDYQPDVKPG
jgi:hypothetical protein